MEWEVKEEAIWDDEKFLCISVHIWYINEYI